MHGWDLDVKKRNLKCAEIIQIYSNTEKARESHICRILWECMRFTLLYCSSPYRNSKSNVIFL